MFYIYTESVSIWFIYGITAQLLSDNFKYWFPSQDLLLIQSDNMKMAKYEHTVWYPLDFSDKSTKSIVEKQKGIMGNFI